MAVKFQLTAARRRLDFPYIAAINLFKISTHSRAKAAGWTAPQRVDALIISTHSRAKAAGCRAHTALCTHRHFNSQPREGGWWDGFTPVACVRPFQLTAARRRLVPPLKPLTRKACIALFR